MMREPVILVAAAALLGGCATIVHGPYQDVRIDSNPPGATATITAQQSERGPGYLDETKERKVTIETILRTAGLRLVEQCLGALVFERTAVATTAAPAQTGGIDQRQPALWTFGCSRARFRADKFNLGTHVRASSF